MWFESSPLGGHFLVANTAVIVRVQRAMILAISSMTCGYAVALAVIELNIKYVVR
jgi:hypothetical protein